jgi:type I restriction enzyme M protein
VISYEALKAKNLSGEAIQKPLAKLASKDRQQPLFNVSPYTFAKLLGEPSNIAKNLASNIKGYSPKVREVFERKRVGNPRSIRQGVIAPV